MRNILQIFIDILDNFEKRNEHLRCLIVLYYILKGVMIKIRNQEKSISHRMFKNPFLLFSEMKKSQNGS